ncbi:hypothetical protein MPH_09837 [Macrophomina phaseolina MS6]|uniref:Uncharacterized protein n=1 Tax=Macrophomina phaseolina (strain MS6) TaxID=1126212 RepID=K2RJQ5_MACPH|nr:hypothetical protein MPH_09837 [Macrophomina phaseolina MS6]
MHAGSHASLQPSGSQRGKLHKRSSKDGPPRRKSTKKRKDDHVREEEIRAMSAPIAIKRPAPQSGSIMRRDSKKIRRGFSRHFEPRPTSDVSLPMADSIQSSMSGGSELLSTSYKVSSLDIFAPRPTIRYSSSPPIYNWQHNAADRANNVSRTDSQRRRSPISKETLKESKTIDDLADDMDAGTLRELMERDQRRKERKRKSDEERLRRKLEKKAEKQRQKEMRREQEAAARADAELDVALGLGIEESRPVTAESARAGSRDGYAPRLDTSRAIPPPTPAETTSSPVKTPVEDPVVATAQTVRYSHASQQALSPPTSPVHQHARGPSNVSDLPELTHEVTPSAVQPSTISRNSSLSRRRSSDTSKRAGWWSTFKRRPSALLKRRSIDQNTNATAPSEISFSNTSRESMARQALPPHLVQQPVRKRSGTPVRTMSKFREDLPERMPLSPPDSRVQSPEVSSAKALAARRGLVETPDLQDGQEVPATLDGTGKIRTDSPVSPAGRTSALMSTSLASVDSEGSWLSGKPVKRGSRAMRSSYGSSFRRPREEWNASYEELGIPDDEYFRRLTPGPEESSNANHHEIQRKPSSVALAANADAGAEDFDEEDEEPSPEETVVHNSIVRKPTVVHRKSRAKSQEGLLSFFPDEAADVSAGGDAMEGVIPGTPVKDDSESPASLENSPESPEVTVHRASSVNLSKNHVRQFSGSSAKLLDIRSSRSSLDAKRASAVSQASPNPQS